MTPALRFKLGKITPSATRRRMGAAWAFLFFAASFASIIADEKPSPRSPEYQLEIWADLDGDGVQDHLVSEPVRDFGQSGGSWEVFLGRKEGGFALAGTIYAHPLALRVERGWDSTRLWIYLKSSGSSGGLGYYTLKAGAITGPKEIEIFPGDGGTDLGNALMELVFAKNERLVAKKKEAAP